MSVATESKPASAWVVAARLIARWLERRERVDELLEAAAPLTGAERARCQHLVFGVIRHYGRIDAALGRLVARPPRSVTRAVLLLAGFELIEAQGSGTAEAADHAGDGAPVAEQTVPADGRVAKIVHHAVQQAKHLASPAEARLANAVVRKLAAVLAVPPPPKLAPADVLAEYFSHPEWLVRSWLAQFGATATRALLEWNQQRAPVYARWRPPFAPSSVITDSVGVLVPEAAMPASGESAAHPASEPATPHDGAAPAAPEPAEPAAGVATQPPDWLKTTPWPGYYEVPGGRWSDVEALLKSGRIYLQDPATRIAVELLAPLPGETVLDGCAAPGGKSLLIADAMGRGKLVAADLPGARIDRLKENLSRVPSTMDVALVQGDLRERFADLLQEHGQPRTFAAVLLDVPCSNTGVMRHRVDVKWRLQEGDFRKHPRQQLALLAAASRFVAPGGRLVYSTCSIDTEENEHVVHAFLADRRGAGWELEDHRISRPWETGHDGGAAFRLRRKAD